MTEHRRPLRTGFIIELTGLKGRKRLDVPVTSLLDYEF